MSKVGILLSGGGARGAYQAGCLLAFGEILKSKESPFSIISGISAGSINASYIASYADEYLSSTKKLCELWSNISFSDVVDTRSLSLARNAMHWVLDLGLGRLRSGNKIKYLVNSAPLKDLLTQNLKLENISENMANGIIDAFSITATDYQNQRNITFVESKTPFEDWKRFNRESRIAEIGVEHIMASASIPIIFPPVRIKSTFYGDGALRNTAPLSPVLKLGARKLIVIGVKCAQAELPDKPILPTPARQLSCLINSALLDGIDMDMDRLEKFNKLLAIQKEFHDHKLNYIEYLYLKPSQPISKIARSFFHLLPSNIKYLIDGLGSIDESEEILSYLLFEGKYCKALCDLGYKDTLANAEQVKKLFS